MYRPNVLMLLNLLLLTAAIFAAGCAGNKGIFDDANYQPVSSRTGVAPPFCYGRKRQMPECDRPLKVEEAFKKDTTIAYTAPALQRLSWYIDQAPEQTASSWVMGDFVYELSLEEKIVIPVQGQSACRAAALRVKIFKSPVPWKPMADSFCYSPDYRLWLPKGYTPATLGN